MGQFKKALLGAAAVVVATAGFMPAQAYLITATTPFALVNLGTGTGTGFQGVPMPGAGPNGTTITATGPTTGLYSGSVPFFATSPFGTGSNQDYYGVQPGGTITFKFTSARTSYSLLIGTIDSYNSLNFTTSGATGTETITGTNIMTSIGGSANGMQTRYLTITGLNPFNQLTFSDTQASAFEFVPAAVPEPVSMAILGAGLIGMGMMRRRSAK